MIRKALLTGILALALAGGVQAAPITGNYITTNGTLNLPNAAGVPGVIHVDGGNNAGVSYTNAFTSTTGGTLTSGTPLVGVGSILLSQYTVGPPPGSTSNFNNPHNIVATFAVSGTVTGLGPQFTGTFTTGTLNVYDTGSTGWDASKPTTWTSGTVLASYRLAFQDTMVHNNVVSGPMAGPFFGAQIVQPGSAQDTAIANTQSPFNSSNNILFNRVSGSLLVPNVPGGTLFDGLFVNSNETILNPTTGGDNGLGASGIATLNTIANAFIGTNFVTMADPFTPGNVTSNFNGDTSQSLGVTGYPVYLLAPPPPGVPEPASMLLWGALTVGMGAWGSARRLRKV